MCHMSHVTCHVSRNMWHEGGYSLLVFATHVFNVLNLFATCLQCITHFSNYYNLLDNLSIRVLWYLGNVSISCNLWIILNLLLFWNLGGGGDQTCMQKCKCLSYRSLQARKESLEAFQTSWRRRRWRGREGMRRICRTPCWWRRALVSFPCISCYKVLSAK